MVKSSRKAKDLSPRGEGVELCFVIGRPRSGTTVFGQMLHTHPEIYSLGEIFNESRRDSYFAFLGRRAADDPAIMYPGRSVANFLQYLEECKKKACGSKPETRIVVVDVKYDQAHLVHKAWSIWGEAPRLFSLIREQGWYVLDLHRRDIVAMEISNRLAIKTKIYRSTSLETGAEQNATIRIEPSALVRNIQATNEMYALTEKSFLQYRNYRRIDYEDILSDGEFSPKVIAKLCRLLAVPDEFDRRPKLEKLLKKHPMSYVENADELLAAFKTHGIEYA